MHAQHLLLVVFGQTLNCYDPYDSSCTGQIDNVNRVNCFGFSSCRSASQLSASTARCWGSHACYQLNSMLSKDEISCNGYKSCSNSFMAYSDTSSNSFTVGCHGKESCLYSNITNRYYDSAVKPSDTTIDCSGSLSCSGTRIIGESMIINAFGNYSLSQSILDVNDSVVNMYGNDAGYNSSIICRDSLNCNLTLNCFDNGCLHTSIFCVNNGDSIYNQSESESESCISVNISCNYLNNSTNYNDYITACAEPTVVIGYELTYDMNIEQIDDDIETDKCDGNGTFSTICDEYGQVNNIDITPCYLQSATMIETDGR